MLSQFLKGHRGQRHAFPHVFQFAVVVRDGCCILLDSDLDFAVLLCFGLAGCSETVAGLREALLRPGQDVESLFIVCDLLSCLVAVDYDIEPQALFFDFCHKSGVYGTKIAARKRLIKDRKNCQKNRISSVLRAA